MHIFTAASVVAESNTLFSIGIALCITGGALLVVFLLFRLIDGGRLTGPTDRALYYRAERLAHNRECHTRRDYDKLMADILALRARCRKGSFYYSMIGYSISHVNHRIFMESFRRTLPYATEEEIRAAHEALGLQEGFTAFELEQAIEKARAKYNTERLAQRNAPKPVRQEAQQRLNAAEEGYDLLKNM